MNIQSLFSLVDTLKPNAYENQIKLKWLNEVEAIVADTIQHVEFIPYENDYDGDLLIPTPYTNVYEYYIKAMIDNESKDYEGYSNNMLLYNNAFGIYSKYYIRNNASTDTAAITNIW